jgi:hypothetical protein
VKSYLRIGAPVAAAFALGAAVTGFSSKSNASASDLRIEPEIAQGFSFAADPKKPHEFAAALTAEVQEKTGRKFEVRFERFRDVDQATSPEYFLANKCKSLDGKILGPVDGNISGIINGIAEGRYSIYLDGTYLKPTLFLDPITNTQSTRLADRFGTDHNATMSTFLRMRRPELPNASALGTKFDEAINSGFNKYRNDLAHRPIEVPERIGKLQYNGFCSGPK